MVQSFSLPQTTEDQASYMDYYANSPASLSAPILNECCQVDTDAMNTKPNSLLTLTAGDASKVAGLGVVKKEDKRRGLS